MSKKQAETTRTKRADASDEDSNLDRQYGNIGISAVVAALPYAGNGKNSAYASTREDDERRSSDRRRSVLAV
jgi:hypothetical protein